MARTRQVIEDFGGRRFLLCLGCGVVCTVLVWNAKISDEIYRDIIISTVAAYIAGNSYQKVKAPSDRQSGSD